MKKSIVFDEETGRPLQRYTFQLKGRSDEDIQKDIEELARILGRDEDDGTNA